MWKKKHAYRILVMKSEENNMFGKTSPRQEDAIKMDIKNRLRLHGLDSSGSGYGLMGDL
jgi:hypothetical protein